MAFFVVTVDTAEARRGGSFGSRGSRTFQSAPTTNTAPTQTAPLQRSMTPSTGQQQPRAGQQAQQQQQRPGGFLGGIGGGLLGGLFLGGLFGMFLGHGFGGLGGLGSLLMQAVVIGGLIWLAMRFLRPRNATAGGPLGMNRSEYEAPRQPNRPAGSGGGMGIPGLGTPLRSAARKKNPDEIGTTEQDLATFERMLEEVQGAFGREDYATLRRLTTPEMVSYLSEELAENATNGVKNEVADVKLLQGDVAESWREGNRDYVTVAMRYSSRDVTLDRDTGRVVQGDAERATETTELWTFTREKGTSWKLSAIQDATTSL